MTGTESMPGSRKLLTSQLKSARSDRGGSLIALVRNLEEDAVPDATPAVHAVAIAASTASLPSIFLSKRNINSRLAATSG